MRVLYIVGQSTGGLPHYTAELANAMTAHADVSVLKPSETSADDLFSDEVDVRNSFESIGISLPKMYDLDVNPLSVLRGVASYSQMREVHDLGVDVVHDTTGLFPQVKFFTKRHGVDDLPFVVTQHEVPMDQFPVSKPDILVEQIVLSLLPEVSVDQRVVHTAKQKEALLRKGEDPENVSVIPHGAYEVFGDYEDVDRQPERNCLLFFGHVIPPKGVDTLVKAVSLVAHDIPDVTLVVAGEGKLSAESREIVESNPEHFEIRDYYIPNDEVKDLFGRAEAVVVPYRDPDGTNGHSGALSTAFSFGKPIVASTAGEFPELVGDTGCGLVVPPNDPEALADAITGVLENDEARAEMAVNSRRMAERLSWDSIAEQYFEVYKRAVNEYGVTERKTPSAPEQ